MKKKILVFSCILFTLLVIIFFATQEKEPEITLSKDIISATPVEKYIIFNENNIKNINSDLEIRIWKGGITYHLKGILYYEKDNKFRMIIDSVIAREADLGSNDNHFWFYFKRMKNSALYFAKHEDLEKAKMKKMFNPTWIMQSLGLNSLTMSETKLMETNDNWLVIKQEKDEKDQLISKIAILDKKNREIKGFLIINEKKDILGASEITKKEGVIPKEIVYTWNEEGIIMKLSLINPKINVKIDPKTWQMPEMKKVVNLSTQ